MIILLLFLRKLEKSEQIGLNIDTPYWVSVTENYSCSTVRLTDLLVGVTAGKNKKFMENL